MPRQSECRVGSHRRADPFAAEFLKAFFQRALDCVERIRIIALAQSLFDDATRKIPNVETRISPVETVEVNQPEPTEARTNGSWGRTTL